MASAFGDSSSPRNVLINDPDSPGSDDRIRELEQKVADLEDIINKFMSNANFSGGGKPDPADDHRDDLKPMHPKDIKPPPEYGGARKEFMSWHESFASMLRCKSSKWDKVIEWLKSRREKRILDGQAKAEYEKVTNADEYVLSNFENFQKHLYRYLLDFTKDKARTDVLVNKESGVFESYRAILHKGLNISEERRLDVEARILNPRRAKNEKDILNAVQEWRNDQAWLVEAGYDTTYKILRGDGGRMAMTILIKMMPADGNRPMQKHLREFLSKANAYDELEEELYAELYRRESESEKKEGCINQVEDEQGEDGDTEWVESTAWHQETGWIQVLTPNAKRARLGPSQDSHKSSEDEETPPDSKVPKGKSKGKGKGGGGWGPRRLPGTCWQCGAADHYQADCPKGSGKNGTIIPAAWSSWRPGPWPGPTPAQWRSFMPRTKGCGKAKGSKGKGKTGKGKGKGLGNEGDAAYVGYDFVNENYYSEYPTFAGDIGLLTECIPAYHACLDRSQLRSILARVLSQLQSILAWVLSQLQSILARLFSQLRSILAWVFSQLQRIARLV